jgi:hypothetical protein
MHEAAGNDGLIAAETEFHAGRWQTELGNERDERRGPALAKVFANSTPIDAHPAPRAFTGEYELH